MKRSYITSADNVRIACDSVIALIPQEVESEAAGGIIGGHKIMIRAATASGMPVLAVCYPHELDAVMESWTQAVFGGSERRVEQVESGRVVQ